MKLLTVLFISALLSKLIDMDQPKSIEQRYKERLEQEYVNNRHTIEMIRESNRQYIDIALSCKCKK